MCGLPSLTATAIDGETSDAPDTDTAPPALPASLSIDNPNIYEGMDRSYSEGYVPRVAGGNAIVVLPLLCDGTLMGDCLRATVNLGDASSMPFVCRNYEKTVSRTDAALYPISFSLQVKQDRTNGKYPVSVTVTATDSAGNGIREVFTVYVVITDGKAPDADQTQDAPVLTPKVLVQSYTCTALSDAGETEKITAGERPLMSRLNTRQTAICPQDSTASAFLMISLREGDVGVRRGHGKGHGDTAVANGAVGHTDAEQSGHFGYRFGGRAGDQSQPRQGI